MYFASLSARALTSTATSVVAAPGRARPVEVRGERTVMSANTSIARSSSARTSTFMSLNLAFTWTNAPASRHTLAKVLSVGTALVCNLPDEGTLLGVFPRSREKLRIRNWHRLWGEAGGVSRTPMCGMLLVPPGILILLGNRGGQHWTLGRSATEGEPGWRHTTGQRPQSP